MSKPEQGRIIWATVLDQSGRNPKTRPALIVTPTDEIEAGKPFVAVAISTQSPSSSENHVELPWHRDGHARTKLRQRCVAVSDWLIPLREDDIQSYGGVVPINVFEKILARIAEISP